MVTFKTELLWSNQVCLDNIPHALVMTSRLVMKRVLSKRPVRLTKF